MAKWLAARIARALLALACAVLMVVASSSARADNIDQLVERLKNGEDFRVRVQAALQLGKTKSSAAREPLESALDDENAAVRTASAAALKVLGDKQSIPALEKHKNDSSQAVRTQIQATLAALKMVTTSSVTKLIVKLGKMRATKEAKGNFIGALESASREKFGALPGVQVVEGSDTGDQAKGKKVPMVMVTGQLRKMKESAEGSEVVYSASVEYVVHRMPEQAIAGTVSGSASTRASKREAKKRSSELKQLVLTAAVESAVKRAPEALLAATR